MITVLSVSKEQNRLLWVVRGGRSKNVNYWTEGKRSEQTFRCRPSLRLSLSPVLGYKEASSVEL